MKIPKGFFYSEDHIAVKKTKGERVRLYLTDYIFSISDEIEEIAFDVDQGSEVSAGDVLGLIKMPDYEFEIISPVSGTVTKVNSELTESPDVLYGDGLYKDGWLIEIETSDNLESQLMTSEQYKEFLETLEEK
ncbi:MAG: hypothetical protein NZ927_04095 [Candidatus Calescibacterium sp.]|nr:hypothetical protein [Candidatus Calescibacterium sp.]MCX7734264.1 hypothetical protein [bacterium]MDW8087095.1 hypothetical protein [Candidatus Calescibacterium sp.]